MNMSEKTLDSVSVPFLLKPNWDKDKFSNIFKNATIQHKVNDYESKCSMTEIEGFRKPFSEGHIGFSSSTIDFAPKFVSTPKRKITTPRGMLVAGLREELLNRTEQKTNNVSQREPCEKNTATLIKNTLSKSARLLNIVHNSCVSMYRALGIIFCPKPADTKSRSLWKKKFKIDEKTMNKFTKYLKQSITHPDTKVSDHLKVQKQVKRKLAIKQKIRKSIVKQLKNGMHLYGCNFKKIAQAMWPHEKEMTPKVLYHIYRKYILK
ncbi:uncharacterized protein LOC133520835 [Cydia pomonella]|uniref:uncharacterized protein LOC133520835 n=1 Tax=Cydia pomonella TaxID=82600 RepID=UPI002ADDCFFD|nr:uncharacterized protein LOC133520835 [Cydia pomonella]